MGKITVDAAELLGRWGVVELAGRADAAGGAALTARLAAGGAGSRELIALDGCGSACGARRLAATGCPPTLALTVADLARRRAAVGARCDPTALAARAAALIEGRWRAPRRRAGRRPVLALPSHQARDTRTHTIEDYLLAIDSLAITVRDCGVLESDDAVPAAHLHRLLGVSRVAAWEMLERLHDRGLAQRDDRRMVALTAAGRELADRALRRRRLLERFVCDVLRYPPSEAHERAARIAAALDDDELARLRAALGDPERCPHGWAIEPELARRQARALTSLAALRVGSRSAVVALLERSAEALGTLARLGIQPGVEVLLIASHSGAGVELRAGEGRRPLRLPWALASEVLVRGEGDEVDPQRAGEDEVEVLGGRRCPAGGDRRAKRGGGGQQQ
jgi:DtxR family Mn-dependent transcriptional regulator